jgi:hypothetical protein
MVHKDGLSLNSARHQLIEDGVLPAEAEAAAEDASLPEPAAQAETLPLAAALPAGAEAAVAGNAPLPDSAAQADALPLDGTLPLREKIRQGEDSAAALSAGAGKATAVAGDAPLHATQAAACAAGASPEEHAADTQSAQEFMQNIHDELYAIAGCLRSSAGKG